MDLRYVLVNALMMEDNEVLVIPCADEKEAESVRVRLFRLRKYFEPERRITIKKRDSDALGFIIVLEREGPKLVIPAEETGKDLLPIGMDVQRFIQVAVEDGLSLEEIKGLLEGKVETEEIERLFQESLIFKQQGEENGMSD